MLRALKNKVFNGIMKNIIIHCIETEDLKDNDLNDYHCMFKKDGSVIESKKSSEGDFHILYEKDTLDINYKQYDNLETYVKYHIMLNPWVTIFGSKHIDKESLKTFDVENWLYEIGVDKKNIRHEIRN